MPQSLQQTARQTVVDYYNIHAGTDPTAVRIGVESVYIIWFAKVNQHWKAYLATTIPDGNIYDVTWDGDANEIRLDVFSKVEIVDFEMTEEIQADIKEEL